MPVIVSSSAGGQTIISGSAMSSSAGNFLSGSTTVTGSLFVTGSLTVSGSNTFVNYRFTGLNNACRQAHQPAQ